MAGFWFWPRPRINLLLITLDTTRADRLGCYGYEPARTPAIDSLAAAGTLCQRAYTVAPLTLPAHASLVTGLYPAETGVRSNGRGRLDDSLPTLAQVLERQGYDTSAFVASFVLDRKFGLSRGFNIYDDDIRDSGAPGETHHRERSGEQVVDAALAWLRQSRSRPFFTWVHLYDPHAPYLPHADLFGDEFADRPYDAEIAFIDRQIGRLLDFLKTNGLDSRTLIVVAGDHGESLGEHTERTHGMTLYDATLRVPLIFRPPGKSRSGSAPQGASLAENVSLVDVAPTILDMLRLPGLPNVSGRSLGRGLSGGPIAGSLCYGATDEPFLNNGWSPLRSLTDGSWKYVRTTRAELYDLASDPGELRNLAQEDSERTDEMEARLAELESRFVLRSGASVQLRPAERRALSALGYLGGGNTRPAATPAGALPDIKDMLPLERLVDEAADRVGTGELDAAIERLRNVVRQAPAHSKAHWFLALALRRKGDFEGAAEVLRSLLAANPDSTEGHYGLALVRLEQDRPDEAIEELQKTLAVDPDFADAHYDLATVLARRDETDEALAHFDAVLEIDRHHAAAFRERGTLMFRRGRFGEAVADYRRALDCAPDDAVVHHNLGIVLVGQGAGDEALAHLQRAADITPQNAEFQYALGKLLAERGQYDEAMGHLERALKLDPSNARVREALEAAHKAQLRGPTSGD